MGARSQTFPYEVQDVEPDLAKELMEHYTGEKTGFVKVGPKGYFFPHIYKQEAADIYNMPIRPDDVFVNSFPRSGTTLTQEMVWLIKNDLDYKKAGDTKLYVRFPMIEFSLLVHPATEKEFLEAHKGEDDLVEFIKYVTMPTARSADGLLSPRFMKTHLALSLLPPELLDTAKVVYVARDPKDVAVSLFHLYRLLRSVNAVKDFKTSWNYFINDLTYFGPYFEHVKEAWNLRSHPNLLFIFYEDIKHNIIATLRRVATFFGKSYTDQQLQELSEHLQFDKFKTNPSLDQKVQIKNFYNTNAEPFFRKGKVGGWSEYFDEEMKQQAERWIADNLRDTDLRFPSYANKQ